MKIQKYYLHSPPIIGTWTHTTNTNSIQCTSQVATTSCLHSHAHSGLRYPKLLCVKMPKAGWRALAISNCIVGRYSAMADQRLLHAALGRRGGINRGWHVPDYLWEKKIFFFFSCFLISLCFALAFGALEVPQHIRISSAMCRNCHTA